MRKPFLETLTELSAKDPRIILIVGDVGFSFIEGFKEKFPNAKVPESGTVKENSMTVEEVVEVFKETKSILSNSPTSEQTNEEKIVAFIESRTGGDTVRLNEFLKSLYPLPQRNEPPLWLNQGTSKQIKVLLSKMQADGLISIVNNTHELLAGFWKQIRWHYCRPIARSICPAAHASYDHRGSVRLNGLGR